MDEITVKFVGERYVFRNRSLTTQEEFERVIIGTAVMKNGDGTEVEITIKGKAQMGELTPEQNYVLMGKWKNHPKFGRQFHFHSFCLIEPPDKETLQFYLQGCKYVGKAIASRIVDAFGKNTLEIIRKRPEKLTDISGVSEILAERLHRYVTDTLDKSSIRITIQKMVEGTGIRSVTIEKFIEKYGAASVKILKRNPFLLMQFPECGFKRADNLWQKLGLPLNRLKRLGLCLSHSVLEECQQSGSCWIRKEELLLAASQKLQATSDEIERAIEFCERARLLTRAVDDQAVEWIAERSVAEEEKALANLIREAIVEVPTLAPKALFGDHQKPIPELSDSQNDALQQLLRNPVGCLYLITGGPGTGKTYTAVHFLKRIREKRPAAKIAVCAPTGKAAMRIQAILFAENLPLVATTVHRLLEVVNKNDAGWWFRFNDSNKLPHDIILVDEASMLDQTILHSLLKARRQGSILILVADTDQLPPVGLGSPVLDLKSAGLPTAHLTEIHRYAGEVAVFCQQIREVTPGCLYKYQTNGHPGEIAAQESQRSNRPSQVFYFKKKKDQCAECLEDLVTGFLEEGEDVTWNLQVLCAVNKNSTLSREQLNDQLASLLNPNPPIGRIFRVGDKVINNKNRIVQHAKREVAERFLQEEPIAWDAGKEVPTQASIANGEMGEIVDMNESIALIRLWTPERLIVEYIDQDTGNIGDWDLGYAISTHKSQGSEWPYVVIMMDPSPGAQMVMNRNWFYTAVSRAKKSVFLIGEPWIFEKAIRERGDKRKTFLLEQIEGKHPEHVKRITKEDKDEALKIFA